MITRTQNAKMLNVPPTSAKTSTPFHSNQSELKLQNSDVSIDRYFISPNNSHIVHNDLTSTMDFTAAANQQRLINSTTANPSNVTNPDDIISYQRVKKVIINSTESNEVQLKIKEQILSQLKSIDLAKYSFPNESKPKTDYTYARTTSYLRECKEMADDNVEMPNLCRRSRISPQKSASSSFVSNTSAASPIAISQNNYLQTSLHNIKERVSVYEYLKNFFSNKSKKEEKAPTAAAFIKPVQLGSLSSFSQSEIRINRKLDIDLEEEPRKSQEKSSQMKKQFSFKYLFGLDRGETSDSLASNSGSTIPLSSTSRSSNSQEMIINKNLFTRGTSTMSSNNNNNNNNETPNPIQYVQENGRRRKGCCSFLFCYLPLLFLILLPLFLMFSGLNNNQLAKMPSETENLNIFKQLNEKIINPYLNIDFDSEKMHFLKEYASLSSDFFKHFLFEQVPWLFSQAFEMCKAICYNIYSFLSEKFQTTKETISEKMTVTQAFKHQLSDDLMEKLNELKEKIISETISKFKRTDDIESLRSELDYKFNSSLTMILNQYELSKNTQQSQEKELKQIKDVLNELETNYKFLMQQFQELKRNDNQQKEQQQISNNWQPGPGETISFEKLKEFINQSFYLYNADKTGMTDFASESIGGSILFTRCTETYLDNSRWFTVFDVPITRITVSPRVVIQGSLLQPGNCWAFKGSKADLFIKLAAKITPSSFSLEHIPKELSLTGVIDSAPQNFSVYGYESKDDIRDDNRLLLGNYRYDNNSKYTLQFFSVQHKYDRPIQVIELKIESNAGNKDFTCLYKFRVHGNLFKPETQNENKIEKDQNEEQHMSNEAKDRLKDGINTNI